MFNKLQRAIISWILIGIEGDADPWPIIENVNEKTYFWGKKWIGRGFREMEYVDGIRASRGTVDRCAGKKTPTYDK